MSSVGSGLTKSPPQSCQPRNFLPNSAFCANMHSMFQLIKKRWFAHRFELLRGIIEAHFSTLFQEIHTMAESIDQRIDDLTVAMQKTDNDFTQFRTDVMAALAAIGSGPLTDAQQAAFDNLMAQVQAHDQAILDADAALPHAPTP